MPWELEIQTDSKGNPGSNNRHEGLHSHKFHGSYFEFGDFK